ncbi:sulfotransferase domain-containing protein [Novosphingobium decolorationis]|uniref:Sulfotransferase domain-containing protein n=1 Tax=Novosphingobium decolorationis TaxID=2698673 RepID=A0ABX8E454_9SPHN|nr:sulfotransferase domain-containing protein [Novosphingobium decolorationis]QVM83707.1 sulfotransferase domain-containing protein [Novosphingobium decolorationis]
MSKYGLKSIVSKSSTLKAAAAYLYYSRETRARFLPARRTSSDGAVFFTMQKCASTYITKALAIVEECYAKTVYNFEGLYWSSGDPDMVRSIHRDAEKLFVQPNAIYGPMRNFFPVPNLEKRPLVLMLRDPRDVLVSSYYSVAYSHNLPGGKAARQAFEERRSKAQAMDIDAFVKEATRNFFPRYKAYADNLLGRPNLTFLTYENLIEDPEDWAERFLVGMGLEPVPTSLNRLVAAYSDGLPTGDKANDKNSHRRSGASRQFETMLKPETIAYINEEIGDVLERFAAWEK